VYAGGQLVGDSHSAVRELPRLFRVVAEEPDRRCAQCVQHLGGGRVIAFVLAMAECEVGLIGVQPGVLQCVGVDLGVEPYAAAFLAQVQQVAAGFGNQFDRLPQLSAAVAPLAAQHITGQAFAVNAHERHR